MGQAAAPDVPALRVEPLYTQPRGRSMRTVGCIRSMELVLAELCKWVPGRAFAPLGAPEMLL